MSRPHLYKYAKRTRLNRIADELDWLEREFKQRDEEEFKEAEMDVHWALIFVRNAARALGLKL